MANRGFIRRAALSRTQRAVAGALLVAYVAVTPCGPWLHDLARCPCDAPEGHFGPHSRCSCPGHCGADPSQHESGSVPDGPRFLAADAMGHATDACPFVRFQSQKYTSDVFAFDVAESLLCAPCAVFERDLHLAADAASFQPRAPPAPQTIVS
ncbi:MAG: hypothetical protein JW809_11790 [Pirellulales bacterium]|nr:hypothetical protein [Pirellulales bacterium]